MLVERAINVAFFTCLWGSALTLGWLKSIIAGENLAKFLAAHPLITPTSIADATPAGKWVKANSTVDTYWVRS